MHVKLGKKIDDTRNNIVVRFMTFSIIHVRCSKMILQWAFIRPWAHKQPQKTAANP